MLTLLGAGPVFALHELHLTSTYWSCSLQSLWCSFTTIDDTCAIAELTSSTMFLPLWWKTLVSMFRFLNRAHTCIGHCGEPFSLRGQRNTRDILFRDAVFSQHIISGVRLGAVTACTNMASDVISLRAVCTHYHEGLEENTKIITRCERPQAGGQRQRDEGPVDRHTKYFASLAVQPMADSQCIQESRPTYKIQRSDMPNICTAPRWQDIWAGRHHPQAHPKRHISGNRLVVHKLLHSAVGTRRAKRAGQGTLGVPVG